MSDLTDLPGERGERYILGIDPGKATGIAIYQRDRDRLLSTIIEGGIEGFAAWYHSIVLAEPEWYEVVIEKFSIMESTAEKTRQYDALYINGFVLGSNGIYGIPTEQHLVSNVKKFATNKKLKNLGWYKPGAGHDNDAARHVLAYVSKFPWAQDLLRRSL